jgi:serine protease AprX
LNDLQTRAAALLLSLVPAICWCRSPKLARDLDISDPRSSIDVIVQFAVPPDGQSHERMSRRGGRLKTELGVIRAALYTVTTDHLADIAEDPDVVYISPDREVRATLDTVDPTLNVPLAWQYGFDGTGVGVAVIDSGILQTRDFLDNSTNASNVYRIVYSQSFVPRVSSTADQYGHGTHVAGIVAGNGNASTGPAYSRCFAGLRRTQS